MAAYGATLQGGVRAVGLGSSEKLNNQRRVEADQHKRSQICALRAPALSVVEALRQRRTTGAFREPARRRRRRARGGHAAAAAAASRINPGPLSVCRVRYL